MNKSKFLETLAAQVAGGSTIKAAAATVGCSLQTAYNISASSEFRQRVSEIRSEVSAQTVGELTAGARLAAQTVVALLDEQFEPSVRLQAAKAIFAAVGPATDLGELRARLDELERQQKTKLGVAS